LLSLLVLIYSSALFWTLGPTGSLRICTPLILNVLRDIALDLLDLCLYFLDVLLDLTPEHFATLGMFCILLFGDWKLFSHLNMHSGYGRVHGACLLPTGQSTLAFLFHDCFYLGTPCFRSLPRPFFHVPRLSDFALCGYPHCETCAFACLLCRLLVNVPFLLL
jgi:hypothetical protein